MSLCPKADAMEKGLITIVNELMSEVWVDCGKDIPGLHIWEDDRQIEVIPIDREQGQYKISMRVGKKDLAFEWCSIRSLTDLHGVRSYAFGDCTGDELAIAGGLMLMYYGQAMAD